MIWWRANLHLHPPTYILSIIRPSFHLVICSSLFPVCPFVCPSICSTVHSTMHPSPCHIRYWVRNISCSFPLLDIKVSSPNKSSALAIGVATIDGRHSSSFRDRLSLWYSICIYKLLGISLVIMGLAKRIQNKKLWNKFWWKKLNENLFWTKVRIDWTQIDFHAIWVLDHRI